MLVVWMLVGAAAAAAATTLMAARRWPRIDPAAPTMHASSPPVRHAVRSRAKLRSLLRSSIDPATATALVLTVSAAIIVVLIAVTGGLLVMIETHTGLEHYDLSLARWAGEHATSSSTSALRAINTLGGTIAVLSVAVVAGVVEFRRLPNRAIPGVLALTVLGQFAISNLVKALVNRPRPAIHQLSGYAGSSFPSGHATAAAATFAVVALLLGRQRTRGTRHRLAAAAVGITVLVAGGRVLLGVHWFTDVLAGIAIGWAWAALSSIAFGGRILHFGAPVAEAEVIANTTD